MPTPVGSRAASPIQTSHTEAPNSPSSTTANQVAEKSTQSPGGVLSNFKSRPSKRSDIESNQGRLAILQNLNNNKLINNNVHYSKAAPIAAQIKTQLPEYQEKLEKKVSAGDMTEGEYLARVDSMAVSLKGVEKVGSSIADLDAGGQGLAQTVGTLLRTLVPDIAEHATDESIQRLGRDLSIRAQTGMMPDDVAAQNRVSSAISALDLIKQFQASQNTSLIPQLQNALRQTFV
jgi:hypothetical protein